MTLGKWRCVYLCVGVCVCCRLAARQEGDRTGRTVDEAPRGPAAGPSPRDGPSWSPLLVSHKVARPKRRGMERDRERVYLRERERERVFERERKRKRERFF